MRYYLLILILAFSCRVNAQGFSTSVINWITPLGGYYTSSGDTLGYNNFYNNISYNVNSQNWKVMDMDGDARPDLVVFATYAAFCSDVRQFGAGTSPYWKVYLNTGTGISLSPVTWLTPVGGAYTVGLVNLGFNDAIGNSASAINSENWNLIDMNGDAKPDLVITAGFQQSYNSGVQFGFGNSPYWKVYLNTGTGFTTSPINWLTPDGIYKNAANVNCGLIFCDYNFAHQDSVQNWNLTDINGDAKPDLIFLSDYNQTTTSTNQFGAGQSRHWKVYLNNGTGFSTTAINWSTPIGGYYSAPGVNHGYFALQNLLTNVDSAQIWDFKDMDGDAKPDLVVFAEYLYATNGLMQYGSGSSHYWKIFLNTGTGFSATPLIWTTPSGGSQYGFFNFSFRGAQWAGSQNWGVEDLNGDNKPDLVITAESQMNYVPAEQFGLDTFPFWKVYLNSGNGFDATPVNWLTPRGGEITSNGLNLGYFNLNQQITFNNNSQNWNIADMNGDHISDFIVTSEYQNTYGSSIQFFSGLVPLWRVYLNSGYTGLMDPPTYNTLSVYPNPVESMLYVDTKDEGNLTIYNVTGESVYQKQWTRADKSVDLSFLSAGVYVVKLVTKQEIRTTRIIR